MHDRINNSINYDMRLIKVRRNEVELSCAVMPLFIAVSRDRVSALAFLCKFIFITARENLAAAARQLTSVAAVRSGERSKRANQLFSSILLGARRIVSIL